MSATTTSVISPPARRRIRRANWTAVPVVALAYAFLYDNSTGLPTAMGAGWTQLLELPREIRILEAVLVGLAVLLVIDRGLSRLSRNLLIGVAAFMLLSTGSQMFHPLVSLVDSFRLAYAYILPILIYVIGREGPFNERSRDIVWRFILGWIILNVAVSWFQFVWLRYPLGDDITGLNKDAHTNGNLFYLAALMLTARALFQRRKNLIAPVIGLLITAVLTSVLKSFVFSFFAFGLQVLVSISGETTSTGRKLKPAFRKRILPIAAGIVLVVAGGLAFSDLDQLNSSRVGDVVDKISSSPLNFGPLGAHLQAMRLVTDDVRIFLLGNGPFSFANPVSVGQSLSSGNLSKYAQAALLARIGDTGIDTKVTLTSGVLVEQGFPALMILLWAYSMIGWSLWKERNSTSNKQVAYAMGLIAAWLSLMLTALMSVFGSLDTISISWPIMFLAGITCRIEKSGPEAQENDQSANT